MAGTGKRKWRRPRSSLPPSCFCAVDAGRRGSGVEFGDPHDLRLCIHPGEAATNLAVVPSA